MATRRTETPAPRTRRQPDATDLAISGLRKLKNRQEHAQKVLTKAQVSFDSIRAEYFAAVKALGEEAKPGDAT